MDSITLPAGIDSASDELTTFDHHLESLFAGELGFEIHYQPIVDLERGSVTGYEALARFPAVLGAAPDLCFARADQLGKRTALEALTLRQSLLDRRLLPSNAFLSVNVSPAFLFSAEWGAFQRSGPSLSGVVLEITEETSIVDYTAVRRCLEWVREAGGLIAVDDAGAGYASLTHILEIRPEFIKLDRRFVQNCQHDRAKSTLIEMMGAAANRLDAWIVAEGVEVQGELEELILLGVPLAQGYLLGRPSATMQTLEAGASQVIESRQAKQYESDRLKGLLMGALPCASYEMAVQALREKPEYAFAVVVDQWERPVRLVQRHPLLGIRQVSSFLRVQVTSEPGDVLHRAFSRDLSCRYDPVVVIASDGQLVGVAEIDRLVRPMLGTAFGVRSRPLQ